MGKIIGTIGQNLTEDDLKEAMAELCFSGLEIDEKYYPAIVEEWENLQGGVYGSHTIEMEAIIRVAIRQILKPWDDEEED